MIWDDDMIWWYEMMRWDDDMGWWYDMIWWYDMMIWWYDDMRWWYGMMWRAVVCVFYIETYADSYLRILDTFFTAAIDGPCYITWHCHLTDDDIIYPMTDDDIIYKEIQRFISFG